MSSLRSRDLCGRRISNEQVLSEYASLRIILNIASISLPTRISLITRLERSALQRSLWVSANCLDLLRQCQRNRLILCGGACGSRILVLLDGRDFWIDGLERCARLAGSADALGIALEGAVDKSGSHASNVFSSLGVCEGLVGGSLLQAGYVGDLAFASGCGLHELLERWELYGPEA